jgi:hypothetical protein
MILGISRGSRLSRQNSADNDDKPGLSFPACRVSIVDRATAAAMISPSR